MYSYMFVCSPVRMPYVYNRTAYSPFRSWRPHTEHTSLTDEEKISTDSACPGLVSLSTVVVLLCMIRTNTQNHL